jgi:predicted patatin/cPLA2 family phospholipase
MSFKSWLKTGDIVGAEFCYKDIPDRLDPFDHEAFGRRNAKFYATVTNLETGKAEHIELPELRQGIDWVRASASLPYFSRPVEINGVKYLDGGCADSVPVKAFRDMGYERNVVILTKEAGYRKKSEAALITKLKYRKYPAFAKVLLNRAEDYNRCMEEILEMEKRGEVFLIQPSVKLDIGRTDTDPDKIQRAYDQGVADGKALLGDLKAWLKMTFSETP